MLAGIIYTLSPLTVLAAVVMVPLARWAVKDVPAPERRWLVTILSVAITLRVLAVLALFLATDHSAVPFRTFFGDEDYFLRRSIWLRNIALGFPVHRADYIYAYDPLSRTSYVYALAVLQVLVGPAPYGAHLVGILCSVAAAIVLYRVVRPSFGGLIALLGLTVLLFLPSLFVWSVSVLKESLFGLVLCLGFAAAAAAARSRTWPRVMAAVGAIGVSSVAAGSMREGGLVMAGVAGIAGAASGFVATRPRAALAGAALVLAVASVALPLGPVRDRIVTEIRRAATVHFDTVNTRGSVYTILDDGFYQNKSAIQQMTLREGVQYVTGALAYYIVVPLPWRIRSWPALAYLPEQVLWYVMMLLMPIGFAAALRRDPALTMVLSAYAAAAILIVALTSGNVGTLVRHRGLAVPFLVWFSVLGACEIVARSAAMWEAHADHR
jgi:hypothetical protein